MPALDLVPVRWFTALVDRVALAAATGRPRSVGSDMGRSVIGLCAGFGLFIGGYIPELWGSSAFSFVSLLFSVFGGIAGIWLGIRLTDY